MGRAIWAVPALALTCLAWGCDSDDGNPLSAAERELVGDWRLDLPEVDADDFAFTYRLRTDHTLRNRMGGAFLRRLRDHEALAAIDLGQLGDVDQIDGAYITWHGTWALQGDSLHVVYQQLEVDVLGDLPLIGDVTVPVYGRLLDEEQQAEVTYAYAITGDRLVLRGAAASAGVADAEAEAQTAGLDPLARGALEVATQVLLEAYQGSDANEFVYLRAD